jgi:hypothetical protein
MLSGVLLLPLTITASSTVGLAPSGKAFIVEDLGSDPESDQETSPSNTIDSDIQLREHIKEVCNDETSTSEKRREYRDVWFRSKEATGITTHTETINQHTLAIATHNMGLADLENHLANTTALLNTQEEEITKTYNQAMENYTRSFCEKSYCNGGMRGEDCA